LSWLPEEAGHHRDKMALKSYGIAAQHRILDGNWSDFGQSGKMELWRWFFEVPNS